MDLEEKAKRWVDSLPYKKRWRENIRIEESALLVIDMQNYFLDQQSHAYLPDAESILEDVNTLVALFTDNSGKVIYTRTIQEEDSVMSEWWNDRIEEGPMAELSDRLLVKGEVMVKNTYSSFHETELDEMLNGVKNVFISGVMTDICCDTTARDAFVRDYRVFFLADGTATSSEELHVAALNTLSHGIAEVMLCRDVRERLRL